MQMCGVGVVRGRSVVGWGEWWCTAAGRWSVYVVVWLCGGYEIGVVV